MNATKRNIIGGLLLLLPPIIPFALYSADNGGSLPSLFLIFLFVGVGSCIVFLVLGKIIQSKTPIFLLGLMISYGALIGLVMLSNHGGWLIVILMFGIPVMFPVILCAYFAARMFNPRITKKTEQVEASDS